MSWTISRAMLAAYENSHCSQEQEAASLEESFLAGEQSAQSNTTPTPDQFYWPDKTTEHFRLSRFGMTCEPLTPDLGAAVLTWFLEDFPARTSVLPEVVTAWKANAVGSGRKWIGLLARYDRDSSMWRTPQCSLVEGLDEYSETWPRWGSMRNGECWERMSAVPPTNETDSGWSRKWPTPVASMYKSSSIKALIRKDGRNRANDRLDHAVYAEHGGPLNPEWCELLMGWPIGLTDLKPLATARLAEWLQQHGESSEAPE